MDLSRQNLKKKETFPHREKFGPLKCHQIYANREGSDDLISPPPNGGSDRGGGEEGQPRDV